MTLSKHTTIIAIFCITILGLITSIQGSYYKPDFFPIGLTGLNYTGSTPPYNDEGWEWDDPQSDQDEQALIEALDVNCLGCQDAKPQYLVDLYPVGPDSNNYLHKICMEDVDTNIIFKYIKSNL